MPTPPQIVELVAYFHQHRDVLCSAEYNEEQARRELIEPLFAALGWDVQNAQGYAPAYRDVVQEESIRVGGQTKAPDYTFRIGGTRKFFVEAKKPAVALRDDPAPAYQLRRYAWSAKLALSILTNFEELAVYDCRVKPSPDDGAATARVLRFTCDDYLTRWDELAALFTRDAILKGGFDRFAGDARGKRGTAEVDEVFLAAMEGWRDLLAHNLALRNPGLSSRALNAAVQLTLDRIVFLRIAEDRGLEPYGQLQALLNGGAVYDRLVELFRRADDRYNSGLFHFRPEKDRPDTPDEWTPGLALDDKPLKDLLRALYYPDSPYEFSVIPADILGQVYERFLGKVIRLTAGHRAVVEEKPEVKKAGGVFYTPTTIVETIVQQTIGPIVETQDLASPSPARRETQNIASLRELRILDPACGSGSFLLGAYQFLLDWHLRAYSADAKRWAKGKTPPLVALTPGPSPRGRGEKEGEGWRLSTAERKRILLDHLYGVDIDPQAVEVTKLSLLLKALEGETEETLSTQMRFFQERALPDLSHNIRCGNSLIGPEFYDGQQLMLFDVDEQYRINAFDWRAAFPEVFTSPPTPLLGGEGRKKGGGGFDAIIGNPPYIRIQTLKEWAPREVEFYKQRYAAASKGNYDIYVVFVEQALGLLNERGRLGFILPHKFFNAQYGEPLRRIIAEGRHLEQIIHFGDQQVFANATTYTCLLFLDKAGRDDFRVTKVADLDVWRESPPPAATLPASRATAAEWNFTTGPGAGLFERLSAMPVKLENVTDRIFQGLKTSADKIYIVEERERREGWVVVYSPQKEQEYRLEPDLLHPLIKGGDSKRYSLGRTNRLILFPYAGQGNGSVGLIPDKVFKTRYPLTWAYLVDNKAYLQDREDGKMRGPQWYAFGRNQALEVMPLPKIFTPDIAARSSFSLDETGEAFFTGGVAGGYGILVLPEHSREYVLGLLNSKLLEWYIRQIATTMRGGYFSYESRFIRNLPIHLPDLAAPSERAQHDEIVALVELLLRLQRMLAAAQAPHEREVLQRQIETADRQLDGLVYALYGLTAAEIAIVEGKTKERETTQEARS